MKVYEIQLDPVGGNFSSAQTKCVQAKSKAAAIKKLARPGGSARVQKGSDWGHFVHFYDHKGAFDGTFRLQVKAGCACVVGSNYKR